jgi:Iap family predicted aminopeptidase
VKVWTVDATVSVTVEAATEEQALEAGTAMLEARLVATELEPFDFDAWEEV